MRKAFNIGIATGFILSLVLIGSMYVKQLFPSGNFVFELVFLLALFAIIAVTLWVSMNYYCRSSAVQWGSLNFTCLIACVMAAVIVSAAGFFYTTYIHPGYLSELLEASQQNWTNRNYSPSSIAGQLEWAWFDTPLNFALFNFQGIVIVLCIFALVLTSVYYVRNRNRVNGNDNSNNHELIF